MDKNKITIVDNKKLKYVIEPADVHKTSHCVCICLDVCKLGYECNNLTR